MDLLWGCPVKAVSLFSGVEGFGIGFARAGIETVLQAERDPWCLEVLARHYPNTKRVTDVRDVGADGTRPRGRQEPGDAARGGVCADRREPMGWGTTNGIDLVYGGFPCQDLSVAGKRAGLGGERSGLWFEFHRVLRELRPRWAVIENVPGLLSSNQGRDLGVILDGLDELGFDVAWAILDAQHFGVPQRRRRVFIVAGPSRRGAEQVLSLCEGCGGNPAAGEAAGEGVAGTLGGGTGERGWSPDTDRMTFIPIQDAREVDKKQNGAGIGIDGDPMFTLDGVSRHAVAVTAIPFGIDGSDIGFALRAGASHSGDKGDGGMNTTVVASAISASAGHHGHSSPRGDGSDNLVASTLRGRSSSEGVNMPGRGGEESYGDNLLPQNAGVRRLTPLECERLMGWPEDWTRWTAAGKEISDSHRYRMCGNGVVAPVAEWIGHRLVAVDAEVAA